MSTLTNEDIFLIQQKLHLMHLPAGLGTEESACSIGAINLALTGRLTDEIPACMSKVVGNWVILVQDAMPDKMRNSNRWKNLLPLAAGTGRAHEQERLAIIMDWMCGVVLPKCQPMAEKHGFGEAWAKMCAERSATAAEAVASAAARAEAAMAAEAAASAMAAEAEAEAVASAAEWAAEATARAAGWAAELVGWETFDPCAVLQKLVEMGQE